MGEPGVGRMRDRLLLYSGIYRDSFEIFGVDRPVAVGHGEALLQQRDDLLLTQPLAPARERRAIKRQLVPEHHFPTEVLEIRILHQRMNSPATSRVGNGGCPGPTRHTALKRRARKSQSISPASRTSGWRRVTISSRSGRNRSSWRSSRGWLIGLPQQRISTSKESRTTQIGNPKPQKNRHAHPAFLQNRILGQVKSSRSINRFRILHGRLGSLALLPQSFKCAVKVPCRENAIAGV